MNERPANAPLPSEACAAWAARIAAAWRATIDGILAVGRLLREAKAQLPHGEFETMIERELPFKPRTAQRLMKIAADERLSNPTHVPLLPPHWGTLYELTKLNDEQFATKIAAGAIHPELERRDLVEASKRERRGEREREAAGRILALPDKRYGAILADPEWRDEVWSRETGLCRSAENHYVTSPDEVIKSRPIASIAADDCALFLWSTIHHEAIAHEVIRAWGFAYRSQVVWEKPSIGLGRWVRSRHEILLIATRGNPPCPAMGAQWESVIPAERGAHSEKPEFAYQLIEAYFPTVPKIELNARIRRPGWDPWGLEAPLAGELAAE
jgi:N6-adenosine-specific RNA methylase IME4